MWCVHQICSNKKTPTQSQKGLLEFLTFKKEIKCNQKLERRNREFRNSSIHKFNLTDLAVHGWKR